MKRIIHFILIALFLIPCCAVRASHQPEFSTAGFFQLPNSGRQAHLATARNSPTTPNPGKFQGKPEPSIFLLSMPYPITT